MGLQTTVQTELRDETVCVPMLGSALGLSVSRLPPVTPFRHAPYLPAEGRRRNPWTALGRRQPGADFFIMLKAPSLASLSTEAASCEERRDECGPRQERNSTRDCAAAPTAASLV